MGSCGSKPKKKNESSRSSEIVSSPVHTDAGRGFVSLTSQYKPVYQTSLHHTRSTTTQKYTSSRSSTTTPSSGLNLNVPKYSPVYKRPSLVSTAAASKIEDNPTTSRSISSTLEKYDLSSKAHVLVFHHYNFKNKSDYRDGSMHDMNRIKEVLNKFRTDPLKVYTDKTLLEVGKVMDGVSKQDFSKNSCLIVFIMSHGNAQDTIMAYDGQMYSFQHDIVEKCTSIPSLSGKPKIFILQACRGNAAMQADATIPVISNKSDIITFQSTYEGTVAYRTSNQGSLFMQKFLTLLEQMDTNSDIKNINDMLNNEFYKEKIPQTPTLTSTLKKKLIIGELKKAAV